MSTQTPIQIHIPPTLTPLATPFQTFKAAHPTYTSFAVGAFIFSPTHTKLLLVHRASTERGFPNKWEIPGGSTEDTDPTLLHSAARELFEETGLRLTRFVREVGERVEFSTGKGGRWLKLGFEVEVMELESGNGVGGNGHGDGVEDVEIRLDPEEHQAYAWASEEDIRMGKYPITAGEQQALMLKAFELRRSDDDALKRIVDLAGGGDKAAAQG